MSDSGIIVYTRRDGGKGTTVRGRGAVQAKIAAAWKPGMTSRDVAESVDEPVRYVAASLRRSGIIPAKGKRGGWRPGAGRKKDGR